MKKKEEPRGPGRPSIDADKVLVRIPKAVLKRIDALIKPAEKRTEFIREAISRELARREKRG